MEDFFLFNKEGDLRLLKCKTKWKDIMMNEGLKFLKNV